MKRELHRANLAYFFQYPIFFQKKMFFLTGKGRRRGEEMDVIAPGQLHNIRAGGACGSPPAWMCVEEF
jgi:hypothetical protein